ncbi:hypothetical protein [Jiangella mangrovi]|uniref:Uncharacterized protein n=1 Tax=Jiangella mangrovi TaxID=1524084 RepID=A0A7W9GV40_9ACTN|nr:hypothetical protein [Jiangella mangrovi]MBB5790344.1 hypothetical protein [Jiangella mangrovi]
MTAPPDLRPGLRFLAFAVIAAPVVFLLSDIAYLVAGNGINNGVLGGTIGVWSCFLLGWAFVGVSRTLEPHAPRGALALLILAIPAACAGAAFNVNALHWDHFGRDFVEAAFDDGSATVGLLAFLPWGWFAPASFVLTGILVWRTRIAPTWAAALTTLGGVLFFSGRPAGIEPLTIAADVVLVLGVVPIGLAMLSRAGHDRAVSRASQVAAL